MSVPFDEIIVTPYAESILVQIAMQHPDNFNCLMKLLENIKDGVTDIGPDILEPEHHAVDGCGYTVFVSFNKSSDYIQVNDIIYPARNQLRGMF